MDELLQDAIDKGLMGIAKVCIGEATTVSYLKGKKGEPLITVLAGLSQEARKLFVEHIQELEEVA